ncbi:N-6 DNA Methylase family protein [Burkholderia pseudomallei TSV 43]|nr:N-6 DNA Methylase family protein [Burkholderia pseudomallei TSV 43]
MNVGTSISLDKAHTSLGWPAPEEITRPEGGGAAVFASLVKAKIGRALARFNDGRDATVGILTGDPLSTSTEPPIAIVVDFGCAASEPTLRELHRLCWNFSHCPVLITIEPNLLRVWSCCEAPDPNRQVDQLLVHQVTAADFKNSHAVSIESSAAQALHWINLVSGQFFHEHAERFNRDGRADQMLLGNLRYMRQKLADAGLVDDDICHDLLARVIFVQFLFDRKDSDGAAALTPSKLARLHAEGVLGHVHSSFDSILSNYTDTYKLFDWLNERFNGDLFPGKGDTASAREAGWAKEKRIVRKQHLALLADFIRGDVDMPSEQRCLWPQYAFDVIPLEFISSIYETFVTERAAQDGIFYTPPHLVDFVLDRVLPWQGNHWDLKILDPACGSGIFLVKAFQRLVHRWKQANPGQPVRTELLRRLLERNIFGVDKDPHAVRVACFSLYLAMCDEIEPRHYWTQVVFPTMRERRLICSDFFAEDQLGFTTEQDARTYNLIVGNAPWGDSLVTEAALKWASDQTHPWTVANKDIGGLFLAKSALLLKQHGRIAMIQSANSLLFNGSTKATAFRREIFTRYRIEEINNLSALRFKVFKRKAHATKTSISPACVVVMNSETPTPEDRISFVSPKHLKPLVDEFTIVIEPHDIRWLTVREAVTDSSIWMTLMWGSQRDRALLRRLQGYPSLSTMKNRCEIKTREGIIFGDRKKEAPQLSNRQLFDERMFPDGSILHLDADALPIAGDISVHSRDSTDFSAFAWPQLLIKQSWQKESGRFHARLVQSGKKQGVLCNQSYVTVHAPAPILDAACLSFNSKIAVYFMQLTSGRMAAYRPEAQVRELLDLPLPVSQAGLLAGIESYSELDEQAFDAFRLKDAEKALVEDMLEYTLADFRGNENTRGRQTTHGGDDETCIRAYCEYFIRVLKAGFGQDKAIAATIFRGGDGQQLPYRLVAIELGKKTEVPITVANVNTESLLGKLEQLDHILQVPESRRRGIYHQRIARIYDSSTGIPTIYLIKPDMVRYWSRSAGLNDGDEVALDLFRWQQQEASRQGELQ